VTRIEAPQFASFYEAGIDEVDCGWFHGCGTTATTRIEWTDGTQSVGCDVHAIAARRDWPKLIRRLSTWVPS
jgi:hypothetical protein